METGPLPPYSAADARRFRLDGHKRENTGRARRRNCVPPLDVIRLLVRQDRVDVVTSESSHDTSLKTAVLQPRPEINIVVLGPSVVENGTASSENSYVVHVGLVLRVGGAEWAKILSSNQSCFYRVMMGKGVLRCTLLAIL